MSLNLPNPDEYQNPILGLTAERTAVVKGVAGSGKSNILLMKAKQVSVKTSSYAIIVYTKTLKQFFVNELKEIDQNEGHVFYYAEWQQTKRNHYDYLFVDECQDFCAIEIAELRLHGTYCWFFGDTDQSIMDFRAFNQRHQHVQSVEQTAQQLGVHTQDLCINHRLTIENAKVGESIYPNTHLSFACIKHGSKPTVIQSKSQLEDIIKLKQNANLTNIGILVYYKKNVEYIRDYFLKRGVPVECKTDDEMNIDFNSTNLKIIDFHCAKGLQFSNVFIPLCEYHEEYEKSALYVAATRPLDNLYLMYDSRLSWFLAPPTSPIYAGNNQTTNVPFK